MQNKPYKTVRAGLVRAVIWKNASKNGGSERDFYSIQVERLFKRTPSSQWETTNSFGLADLARVQLVAAEAFKFLALSKDEKPGASAEDLGELEVEEVKAN